MDAALSDRLCRNRYIVECKGIYHILAHIRQIRRNRYIVECKDTLKQNYGFAGKGRNRYIVECKALSDRLSAGRELM